MNNIMKYINKIIVLALVMVGFSCTDEDTFPYLYDDIISNQGAFVRLDNVISGEVDLLDIPSSSISFEIEEWDVEDGALLQDITFTVEFIDNTPDNGTNNVAAVDLMTVPASSFTADAETGLPNYVLNMTAQEALNLLGLTSADLDGGDVMRYKWTLNLTNGKSFNSDNQSSSLPAWAFYNSPFLLDVGVVCLVSDGYAIGSYHMLQTAGGSDPFFGDPHKFYEADVMLTEGATSTERLWGFSWISFPSTMGMNLVCGRTLTSTGQNPGASCGGNIDWFTGDGSGFGSFDPNDDSTITLRFWDDYENDCGLTDIVELTLTRN